ncbi:MAG: acyl-CoA reductase [Bacteroidota bacterium]
MNLEQRINLLVFLGDYLKENTAGWQDVKQRASNENGWFTPEYIDLAVANICQNFLQKEKLEDWVTAYQLPGENDNRKTIGLVMAGNIPLVGFHDLLCCFITGHRVLVKTSSKDDVMIKHLIQQLAEQDAGIDNYISFAVQLKNCDAYIATGSNNSSRYFEFYFAKYPHIIRKNRTSVAILDGTESPAELEGLADDAMIYFGLGCRNVTQLYVPREYDFIPLLAALNKYSWASDHHKYRNNYDYNLALHILNNKYYMTNETTLIIEHDSAFAAISQLHYQFYDRATTVLEKLNKSEEVQAIVGHYGIPFGKVQQPSLTDYADGVDTIEWLMAIDKQEATAEVSADQPA